MSKLFGKVLVVIIGMFLIATEILMFLAIWNDKLTSHSDKLGESAVTALLTALSLSVVVAVGRL